MVDAGIDATVSRSACESATAGWQRRGHLLGAFKAAGLMVADSSMAR